MYKFCQVIHLLHLYLPHTPSALSHAISLCYAFIITLGYVDIVRRQMCYFPQ